MQERLLTSAVFLHFCDLQKWGLCVNPQDNFYILFSSAAPIHAHKNALECWQSSNGSYVVSSPGQPFGYWLNSVHSSMAVNQL